MPSFLRLPGASLGDAWADALFFKSSSSRRIRMDRKRYKSSYSSPKMGIQLKDKFCMKLSAASLYLAAIATFGAVQSKQVSAKSDSSLGPVAPSKIASPKQSKIAKESEQAWRFTPGWSRILGTWSWWGSRNRNHE